MVCHHLPSAAAPQELPWQLGWEQLVQLGTPGPPQRTKPAAAPVPGLCVDRYPGTPQADMPNHPNMQQQLQKCQKQLVNLLIWDIVTAKSIAQHHWEASISLTTKRSKGTAGEVNALCLPVPYVYTQSPLADFCPRHSPEPGAFCLTATDAVIEIMG